MTADKTSLGDGSPSRRPPRRPDGPVGLVALDLDGTLLDDRKRIDPQTAAAIGSLAADGVKVVIASARPPRSVRAFHAQLGLDTLAINYNGALIWDMRRRAAAFHRPVAAELARDIVHRARDFFEDVLVSCEVMDRWYTDRFDPTYTTETGRLFRPDVIARLDDFLVRPMTKLLLLGDPRMILKLEAELTATFGHLVSVYRTDPELLQIMDGGAGKGDALRRVAAHYQIPIGRTLAIGDAVNDLDMLDAAGVGVAMGNASMAVKAAADWVAPSNNDRGVLEAIRRYFPSRRLAV